MKTISLERTPQRKELLKRMVDKNSAVAAEARQAFADFISPVINTVLLNKVTSNMVYQTIEFSEDDRPTIPVDLYLGTSENYIRVWSQNFPGGLPTNITQGLNEYTFTTYRLDSAIAFENSYAKNARLDVVTAGMERMINELSVKQERNAWSPLLSAIATATTNGQSHLINATVAGQFQLDDLNRLWTKITRMYTSYVGGTPASPTPVGLTDLFVSPEIMEDVRAFAYNPMNVRGGYKSDGTESDQGNVPLPDSVRQNILNSGGLSSIYNVTLHPLIEFGVGQKYNTLFDNFYQGSFNGSTQQLALGMDLSRPVFLRPVVVDDDSGQGQVQVRPDDQFVARQEKFGFYSWVREGRVLLDDRALVGIIL